MARLLATWRWIHSRLQVVMVAVCTAWLSACGSTAVTSTGPTVVKCSLTLSGGESSIGASGGSQQVVLTTTPECSWTISADASWVTRIEPSSGQGSGTIQIDIAPNPSSAPRQTAITANGVRTAIQQGAAPCEYALSGNGESSAAGGSYRVSVSTAAGCAWTASSRASWVAIANGSSGSGPGVVEFSVEPNPGDDRVGILDIAGRPFTVTQAAAAQSAAAPPGCTFAFTPTAVSVATAGGPGSVSLTATCPWSATTNVPWITVTSPSGAGNANVTFTVAANTGAARSGTLTVGTATASINQAAIPACTATANPTTVPVAASASTGSINVSTPASCNWSAASAAPWITITSGSTGAGNGTVAFSVAANTGVARSGTLTVAGQPVTINQSSGCAPAPNPTTLSVTAAGVTGQAITVTAGTSCAWTGVSNAPWMTITSGASGSGSGSVIFNILENFGIARNGTLTVAGQTISVTQASGCELVVNPTTFPVPISGAVGQIVNVAGGNSCPWTAVAQVPWITITAGASGAGPGSVTFSVAANPGGARNGTLTVGGHTVTVTQGAGCGTPGVNPTTFSPPAGGGTGQTINVTAGAGCTWTAVSHAPAWITVTGGANGSGNGTVTFNVAANTGNARSGTLTVAGQTVTVNQASGCTTSANPTNFNAPAGGGSGQSVNVTAGNGCTWTAVSNANWITVTGGANGSGSGTVTFSVAPNTTGNRNGTLTVAGQTVRVAQPECSYTVTVAPLSFSEAAGTATGTVSTSAGCPWTFSSDASWIVMPPNPNRSGSGMISITIQAFTGSSRTGHVTVAGQTFQIQQAKK